jgi:hypothetical protein
MAKANKHDKQLDQLRKRCENDIVFLARQLNPKRVYAPIHEEFLYWLDRQDATSNLLGLLPRGHQKSHLMAVKAVKDIVTNPCITILYISATSELAEQQLFAIKQMLASDLVQVLWPDLCHPEEGKRTRWNVSDIIVDHPDRAAENVRDCTVSARSVSANITGLHADRLYLDDLVVPGNAYTEEGRSKVESMYSQLASIKNPGARTLAVGTRYHPRDIYGKMLDMEEVIFDDDGNELGTAPVFEILERVVEEQGVFLWPRTRRMDGQWFGFDAKVLARIKAEYFDTAQFYAQYYNNPNDPTSDRVSRDKFQYYDRKFVTKQGAHWFFQNKRLNVTAAIDFAFSLSKAADFTVIVVIGIDQDHNIYVLDIDRFKTDGRIKEYYEHIMGMYMKWGFRKLRAEVTAAQKAIVRELKDSYIRKNGIALSIEDFRPTRNDGSKEERVAAVLEPRYDNLNMWHYKGGLCSLLEDELIMIRPPHDDIKDTLASAVEVAVAPSVSFRKPQEDNVIFNTRFGGVAFK